MKVVFCLRNYLPDNVGGTEIYVHALSLALMKLGIVPVIVKPGFDAKEIREYVYNGIRVIEYPQPSYNHRDFITGAKPPQGLPFFRKVLEVEMPDFVHFHEISGSNGITVYHYEVARSLRIPIYTTLHIVGYVCKTSMLLYKNTEPCDGVIDTFKCAVCCLHNKGLKFGLPELAVSTGIFLENNKVDKNYFPHQIRGLLSYPAYIRNHKAILAEIFTASEKVFVLSMWFKTVLINNSLPETKMVLLEKAIPDVNRNFFSREIAPSKPAGEVRLIYLGRISRVKGLHVLLQAFAMVSATNWRLDIYGPCGEQEYEQYCKSLTARHNDKVFFRSVIPHNEVSTVLHKYDALVFPTVVEEMVGLVVMEAFAAGLPVIGSNSKGITEQVTHNVDGLIFKSGSVQSLAELLQNVFQDPSVLYDLKKNINTPRSFDIVARQVYDAYFSVKKLKSGE